MLRSKSCSDFAQFALVNSRTIQYLWNEIQGLSSTCPVFKYFQCLEFRRNVIKYFQGCVGTLFRDCCSEVFYRLESTDAPSDIQVQPTIGIPKHHGHLGQNRTSLASCKNFQQCTIFQTQEGTIWQLSTLKCHCWRLLYRFQNFRQSGQYLHLQCTQWCCYITSIFQQKKSRVRQFINISWL